MPKFKIRGLDRETGAERVRDLICIDVGTAREIAASEGIVIASVEQVEAAEEAPPTQPRQFGLVPPASRHDRPYLGRVDVRQNLWHDFNQVIVVAIGVCLGMMMFTCFGAAIVAAVLRAF